MFYSKEHVLGHPNIHVCCMSEGKRFVSLKILINEQDKYIWHCLGSGRSCQMSCECLWRQNLPRLRTRSFWRQKAEPAPIKSRPQGQQRWKGEWVNNWIVLTDSCWIRMKALGNTSCKKNVFFRPLPKLPQFGQVVPLFWTSKLQKKYTYIYMKSFG